LDVELVAATRMHVALGENVPDAPLLLKVTVPPGLDFVPADSVSVTVAVHVVVSFIGSVASSQVTLVEVERLETAMSSPVESALEECTAEPG